MLIEGPDSATGLLAAVGQAELQALYQPDDSPLWIDAAGRPTTTARTALALLIQAADVGLDPADYCERLVRDFAWDIEAAPPVDPARFDVVLSSGMLRYLHDVHLGRIEPRALGFRFEATRGPTDFAALLRSAIAAGHLAASAADLEPRFAQYRLLRHSLARYRSLANDPTFVAPPPFRSTVHPGDEYAAVEVLRRELASFGDLPAEPPALPERRRYGGVVVDGVKRFQNRHGLPSDGALGKSTIAALRVPMAWRVRQIELALERVRWLPDTIDQRLIALDIPMFRLWAWDGNPQNDRPALGMDAIVGRALKTETPTFVEEMREVIFRPYWDVPPSILRHDILPKLEADPAYLAREGMEIVRGSEGGGASVDSSADALAGLRRGVLRVRQRPGPKNALGLIKFVFPNQEDVYMHGTPAQSLFAKSRRDFSHGCVRIADPVALAAWVLQERPEWTRDRILAATLGSQTIHVTLPRPVTVVLFYTTAAVMPEDGTIHFADDIYGQDARLDRVLAGRRIVE
jgi:murein L,D-transpeptidase YcbB/YkuD